MDIRGVAEIIGRINEGLAECCTQCLDDNRDLVLAMIREQLCSGLNGEGKHLEPTYDNDPYFEEKGFWHNRGKDYKRWKADIKPPTDNILGLPPRPEEVPNLYITGVFYSEIGASRVDGGLQTDPGNGRGPDIVKKFKENILAMGPTAIEVFNQTRMRPAIADFLDKCGYR